MERKPINLQSSESLTVARGEAIYIPSIDLRDVTKRPLNNSSIRSVRTPKSGSQSARVAILPVIHGFENVLAADTSSMQSSKSPTIVSPYTARTVPVLKLARTRIAGPHSKRVFKVAYIPKKVDVLPRTDSMMQRQVDPSYPNDGTKVDASEDEFNVDGLQSAHMKSSSPRDKPHVHRGQKSPRSNNGLNSSREVHKVDLAALSIDSYIPTNSSNQSAALTECKPPSTTGGNNAFPRRKIQLQHFNDDLEYDLLERKRWPVKEGSSAIPQTLFRNPDIIDIRSDIGGERFTKALPIRFFIKNPTSSLQISKRPLPPRNVHPLQQKNSTKRKEDVRIPIIDDQEVTGINHNQPTVPMSQHEVSLNTTEESTAAAAVAGGNTKSKHQADVMPRINVNISTTLRRHAKSSSGGGGVFDVEPFFPHNHVLDDGQVMHNMMLSKNSSDKEQAGYRSMKTSAAVAPSNASRSSQVGADSKEGLPPLQSRPAQLNMPVITPGGSARGNRPNTRNPQNISAVDKKIDDRFVYSVEINENTDLLVLDDSDSPQSNARSPEVDRRDESHKRNFKATLFIDPFTGHTTTASRGGLFHVEKNPDVQQEILDDASSSAIATASNLARDAQLETVPRQPSLEIQASELALPIARRHISQNALELIQAAQLKPLSGQQILNELTTWDALLTDYEKTEIGSFSVVYFAGRNVADKQQVSVIPGGPHEMKIDEASPAHYCNDAGSYISHIGDHLFYRYEIIQAVGTGSFGDVYECFDYKDSKHVAIKIIKNKAKYLANALEEKRMLEFIHSTKEDSSATGEDSSPKSSSSTCIVELLHHFEFRSHHCFVFPRYGKNLFEFLQQRDFTGLPISFIKKVAVQLLNALVHLHQLGIVHCDLKPENILIRDEKQCSVVLIDFGNSCLASETPLTYIQSRFYRSPEVLFGLPYGVEIDMWSLGCILAELRSAFPSFAGESNADQIACIAEVLGPPPDDIYRRTSYRSEYFDSSTHALIVRSSPRGLQRVMSSRTMGQLIHARNNDSEFVDFLTSCLTWLAVDRMTASVALTHSWLQHAQKGGSSMSSIVQMDNVIEDPASLSIGLPPIPNDLCKAEIVLVDNRFQ